VSSAAREESIPPPQTPSAAIIDINPTAFSDHDLLLSIGAGAWLSHLRQF
jgi:hypothetical protein